MKVTKNNEQKKKKIEKEEKEKKITKRKLIFLYTLMEYYNYLIKGQPVRL